MRLLPRRRPSVGLDIGSAFVRAVGLVRTREGWLLVAAGQAAADAQGGDLRTTVHGLLDELKLKRVSVAVAVPASAAVVRRLSVPAGNLRDLSRDVALEVEDQLPFAAGEATVSYQVLNRRRRGARGTNPEPFDVLLSAARRSEVADRAALGTGPGRRVGVADVEGLALANAFTLNYPDQVDSALLLHIGRRSTALCVIDRGDLVLTRGIALGGDTLQADTTELLTSVRHLPVPDSPRRVFLSGGGWHMEALVARLRAQLGAPVEGFDPLRRIRTSAASRGAQLVGPPFALAVGLALRHKGDG
jgi:Tfp pilus assembly PilM family ATPase